MGPPTPPLAVTETPFYYRQLFVDKVDTRNNSFGILFIIYKSYIIELYRYQRNTIIFCKTTDVDFPSFSWLHDIGYQQSRDKYIAHEQPLHFSSFVSATLI